MAVSTLGMKCNTLELASQNGETVVEYSIEPLSRILLCMFGPSTTKGLWMIASLSSGSTSIVEIKGIDGVTISTGSRKITVTKTSTGSLYPCPIVFAGGIAKTSETAITTT